MRSYVCLLALMLPLVGCRLFHKTPTPHYQTVPASPHRDTETAITEHEKALRLLENPHAGPPRVAKAEEHLQKALVADVTYGPAHNSLGMLYYRQRKLYLAAWEFEYAADLMRERVEPHYNLGLVLEAAGQLDEAATAYTTAYAIDSQNPHVIGNLARAQLRSGKQVADVRPLLHDLVLYDTRPDWVGWAEEQLGLHPEEGSAGQLPTPPAELLPSMPPNPQAEISDLPLSIP